MKRNLIPLTGHVCRSLRYIVMLVLALFATWQAQADTRRTVPADRHLDAQQYMDILGAAMTTLQGHYVDTIDWARVLTAGIDAMLLELDPYCEFYSEEAQDDFKTMTTGEYGGIGALIQQRGDTVLIANPYVGRPAWEAGLRVGDAILAIDGVSMLKHTTAQVSEKLRGQAGTTFTVRVLRPFATEPQDVQIKRRKIVMDAVPYYGWLNDSVGYIYLSSFTDKAAIEVQQALEALRADDQNHLQGLVFDLRSNPGGLMDEAVKIVSMFVPRGSLVVETKARRPEWNSSYRTAADPIAPTLPIVCLVNRNSASAAEILSGALQDMDRAVVMGERSYGKGLVQSTRPLPYNTLMKFTSAKYYIPSGRCIQAIDYSRRDSLEEGEDYRIPDSLTNVFHTVGGREVRDGGGLKPDVESRQGTMSNLSYYLQREYLYHDFANRYVHLQGAALQPDSLVHLSDDDYAAFCQQVTASRKDSVLRILQVVDLAHQLDSLRPELQNMLEGEIALRLAGQRAQSRQSLLFDTTVGKAAALVTDAARYEAILRPAVTDKKAAAKKAKAAAKNKTKKKNK